MRHTGRLLRLTCVLAISLSTFGVYAQSNTLALDEIVVFATPDDLLTVPGSGLVLDQETLERFDHTDLHQILAGTPGIYVREEDGFGLRPNIGIRGATSDRSQKITIMEDGVLITPAPYSAPAAYYVPNVSRMQNIEVIKGPNAIRNGPHTVGGTINFVTESVPSSRVAAVDVSIGSHGYHKLEGRYGQPTGDGGFMIDALRYGSNGFKDLDNGGDTGFDRNEMNAKWSWTQDHATPQRLTLKVGYADETSNETYLGLTDDDFIRNPNRRYLASQMGLFKSNHLNLHLSYGVQWHDSTRLNAKLYLNTFDREWNKLDGFIAGRSVLNVLQRPLLFVREYELLTGTINSTPGVDNDTLDVTNNDRQFSSTGVQVSVSHSLSLASTSHEINAGIRYHTDEVDREHLQRGYLMTDRVLEWDGINRGAKTNNHQSATALALYIEDEISWSDLTVTLGLRFEDIDGERIDFLRDEQTNSSQDFLSPGVGIHWKFTNNIGLIGGVYKGFSPAAPGSSAEPEESLNLEYGVRYRGNGLSLDVLGFVSDYDNLLGRCRVSDVGCNPGDEFNGGNVEISGIEFSANTQWSVGERINTIAAFSYTYTESAFQSDFLSQFSQWGGVNTGDELPYLPEHSGQLQLGMQGERWRMWGIWKWHAEMREEPGTGPIDDGLHTDATTQMDLSVSWRFTPRFNASISLQNATDQSKIVSHRPLGARPNKPRTLITRLKFEL